MRTGERSQYLHLAEHGDDVSALVSLLAGARLGEGAYRRTYRLRHPDTMVAKVEYDLSQGGRSFCNVHEWQVWNELEGTDWERWLAPCRSIDASGAVLLQDYARPLDDAEWEAIGEVPAFLSDAGRRNWGWLEGRPVVVDYGQTHLFRRGTGRKMVPRMGRS